MTNQTEIGASTADVLYWYARGVGGGPPISYFVANSFGCLQLTVHNGGNAGRRPYGFGDADSVAPHKDS